MGKEVIKVWKQGKRNAGALESTFSKVDGAARRYGMFSPIDLSKSALQGRDYSLLITYQGCH